MIHRKQDTEAKEVIPGYVGRVIHGRNITVAHWEIKQGYRVPEHSHPQEQFVNCLEGHFEMTVDGATYVMQPGDTIVIPPNALHSAIAVTDARCLDVFSPTRDDFVFDK